jgi:hypothetical protein
MYFDLTEENISVRHVKSIQKIRIWQTDGGITQLMPVTVPLCPKRTTLGVKPRFLSEIGTISISLPQTGYVSILYEPWLYTICAGKQDIQLCGTKFPLEQVTSSHWTNINLFDSFERRLSCWILQFYYQTSKCLDVASKRRSYFSHLIPEWNSYVMKGIQIE